MTNTRIRTTSTGAPVKRFPTEFHVFVDPITGSANIVFQGEEFLLNADGSAADKLEGRQALTATLEDVTGRTVHAGHDPLTGADLSQITPEGLLQYADALFAAMHHDVFAPEG